MLITLITVPPVRYKLTGGISLCAERQGKRLRENTQTVEILKIVESQFSELTVKMLDIFSDNDMVAF